MTDMTIHQARAIVQEREARVLAAGGIEWSLSNPPNELYYEAQRVLAKRWLQRKKAFAEMAAETGVPGWDLRR